MKKVTLIIFALATILYACGGNETSNEGQEQITASEPDGQALYQKGNCTSCHGAFGVPVLPSAKDLRSADITLEQRIEMITNGSKANPTMISFKNTFSEAEIKAIAEYTMTFVE